MDKEQRIEQVLAGWCDRRDGDAEAGLEEAIARHPDLAEELRACFDALRFVDLALSDNAPLPEGAPQQIGEFSIVREVGRGGMGVVYEAEQASMGRRVALKVLSPAVTGFKEAVERFQREARAAGRLHHTNIVPVYGMGKDRGYWFFAMELVEGRSLGEVISEMRGETDGEASREGRGRLESASQNREHFRHIAESMAGIADALHTAHGEGIIHRDVKPRNLLLTSDGTLKLVDFGLAHLEDIEGSMTRTGQLLGTPHYMSPEQAMAKRIRIDHRTDIYSLGATLYEMITLELPFVGDNLQEVCSQIVTKDPPLPRKVNSRVPRDLETIVLKAMEKDRDRRYQTADELARDLRRFAEGEPIRARRVGPVARALRKVRRNKARAALIASVMVLAVVASLLALLTSRQARAQEYLELCGRAELAIPSSMDLLAVSEFEELMLPGETARDLYSQAIALLPDLAEAWFGRALSPGRTLAQRLADLDAAGERGLSLRIRDVGRAYLERAAGVPAEALEAGLVRTLRTDAPEEAYFLAHLLAADGREDEARTLLTRALGKAEQGSAVRYLALHFRAMLRLKDGDFAGCLEDLRGVEALGDDSVEVRIRIAHCWRRLGQKDRARDVFREALEKVRRTDRPPAWLRLCVACRVLREGRWQRLVTKEAVAACPESSGIQLERALASPRREGLEGCRRAIELDPENALAHKFLGKFLLNRGDVDEAIEELRLAGDLDPTSSQARCMQGQALARMGRYDEALVAQKEAIDRDPRSGMAHKCRGAVLERLGRSVEAVGAYRRAIELLPTYVMTHVRLWNLLRRLGRTNEARAETGRAAETKRGGAGGLNLRSYALTELGRLGEALEAIDAAIRTAPATFLLEARAEKLTALGRPADALQQLAEVGSLTPWGHLGRGEAFLELGRYEEALQEFDEACRGGPSHAGAGRAFLLACLGRFEEAEEALPPVDALDPYAELVRKWRIRTLTLMGRYEDALVAARDQSARWPERVYGEVYCLRALGQEDAARRVARARVRGDPEPHRRTAFAWLCAIAGQADRAKKLLDAYDWPWTPPRLYERAAICAQLGDVEGSIRWLEASVEQGFRRPARAPKDPDFESIQEEPRVRALLGRLLRDE